MTQQPASGRPQKDIRFRTGTDNYEKQVSDVHFTPKSGTPWQGGTPDAVLVDEQWTADVTAIQAWDDPDSFVRFAFEHAGETVAYEYKPHADDAFTLYGTLTLASPTIGGKTNQRNESTLSMPCSAPSATAPVVTP
jgi:hypothetical protein